MKTRVKFGTDGWRALIARDFTFESVSLVADAVADVLMERDPDRKKMIVGFDRRFLSEEFAQCAAAVYARRGYEVLFTEEFAPTPALSWWAKNESGAVGATVLTASHNPPSWNGFKFKETFGGSARLSTTQAFEKQIEAKDWTKIEVPEPDAFEKLSSKGRIHRFNPMPRYIESMLEFVDVQKIRASAPKIAFDAMHGSACDHYPRILERLGVDAVTLHGDHNPGFRGLAPEPIAKNLQELQKLVAQEGWPRMVTPIDWVR